MSGSGAELASLHAIVHGRVQGVFFRAFTRHRAGTLRLSGYVRNLSDQGAVEVVAEGERVRLEELLRSLHEGPAGAKVERVEANWGDYTGGFSGFGIRF